jgi:hypothetical protein
MNNLIKKLITWVELITWVGVVVVVVVVGAVIYQNAQAELAECLRIYGENCTILNGVAY